MSLAAAEPYLSVIIPAYNEAQRITETLSQVRAYLDRQGCDYEVIVAADGDDGTRERVAELAASDRALGERLTVIGSSARGGKGKGIRDGVRRARGRFIGFVDADYKTPIDELDKLLPDLESGCDVVIGSRAVGDSRIIRPQPLYRRWGSKAFKWVMRAIVGLYGIGDTQCGFKFFQGRVAKDLFARQRIDGYMFDVEILRLARKLGYTIKEVGVRWQDDGDSRYDPIAGTWRNARELLRIRFMQYPPVPRGVVAFAESDVETSADAGVRAQKPALTHS
jgi:dolichyl-phosphate beta-glucosyltransferase